LRSIVFQKNNPYVWPFELILLKFMSSSQTVQFSNTALNLTFRRQRWVNLLAQILLFLFAKLTCYTCKFADFPYKTSFPEPDFSNFFREFFIFKDFGGEVFN